MEECSDAEGVERPAAAPNPATPPESVGRFASLRGAQRSGGKQAPNEEIEGIVSSQRSPLPAPEGHSKLSQELAALIPTPHSASGSGVELSKDLADLIPTPAGDMAADAGAAAEDTLPASPRKLPATGFGQADAGNEEVQLEDPLFAENRQPEDDSGEEEMEPADEAIEALPEEPWMQYPLEERELWERVRPRSLRREAAHVRSLRLPATCLSRLMRLHPALQTRSAEAAEVMNVSTVLLLQAVVRAALRGKGPGHRLTFEDIRQACLSAKELLFMHPLSHTLDASTFTARSAVNAADGDEAGDGPRRPAQAAPRPAAPDQRVLGAALFARAAAPAAADPAEAPEPAACEPEPSEKKAAHAPEEPEGSANSVEKTAGKKRRAPATAQKGLRKAARQGPAAVPTPVTSGGIASFFKAGS